MVLMSPFVILIRVYNRYKQKLSLSDPIVVQIRMI